MQIVSFKVLRSVSFFIFACVSGRISTYAYTSISSTVLQSDGSAADTQAAINAASTGFTVQIPAGSFAWSSAVSVSKGIKIVGQGSGHVVARTLTSLTVGTGSKTLTLNASGLAITTGQTLRIYRTGGAVTSGFPTTQPWMDGTVTSYSGTSLTINITSTNGSGTFPISFLVSPATTTVTHNASTSTLLSLTEATTKNLEVSDIRFENGTGTGDLVNFIRASGGQPILFHDCYFTSKVSTSDCIQSNTNRGVIWNTDFVATPFSAAQLAIHAEDCPTDSWSTPSTTGTKDSDGTHNLYIEDCNFVAWLNATDFDNNSRAVVRYCYLNNCGVGTHGSDTSLWGNRHFEFYNNTDHWDGFSNGQTLPMGRAFYLRGGTCVVTDNVIDMPLGTDYPGKLCFDMTVMNLQRSAGPNPTFALNTGSNGSLYYSPRQVGMGYVTGTGKDGLGRTNDAVGYVGDPEPLYFWNNTGAAAITAGTSDFGEVTSGADTSADFIKLGRDYFNGTAKPGYAKFAYPHPLHANPTAPTKVPPSNAKINISTS